MSSLDTSRKNDGKLWSEPAQPTKSKMPIDEGRGPSVVVGVALETALLPVSDDSGVVAGVPDDSVGLAGVVCEVLVATEPGVVDTSGLEVG